MPLQNHGILRVSAQGRCWTSQGGWGGAPRFSQSRVVTTNDELLGLVLFTTMIAYPSMRDDRTLQEEALKMASMRAEAKDAAMYTFESPITRRMSVNHPLYTVAGVSGRGCRDGNGALSTAARWLCGSAARVGWHLVEGSQGSRALCSGRHVGSPTTASRGRRVPHAARRPQPAGAHCHRRRHCVRSPQPPRHDSRPSPVSA